MKTPFATDDGEDELFDRIVVKALSANKLHGFFLDDHQIDDVNINSVRFV